MANLNSSPGRPNDPVFADRSAWLFVAASAIAFLSIAVLAVVVLVRSLI